MLWVLKTLLLSDVVAYAVIQHLEGRLRREVLEFEASLGYIRQQPKVQLLLVWKHEVSFPGACQ